MAYSISLPSFATRVKSIWCVLLSRCHVKVKPFPNRNDRWYDPSLFLLFGLRWQQSHHSFLPVMYIGWKGEGRGILCLSQDRYTLMGHCTLHILLKLSSELSKHIRVYIINSNFSWILFVHSQPCITEVKSFFYSKHCQHTPSCPWEKDTDRDRESGAGGGRRLNTNCFQVEEVQAECVWKGLCVYSKLFDQCGFLKLLESQQKCWYFREQQKELLWGVFWLNVKQMFASYPTYTNTNLVYLWSHATRRLKFYPNYWVDCYGIWIHSTFFKTC